MDNIEFFRILSKKKRHLVIISDNGARYCAVMSEG